MATQIAPVSQGPVAAVPDPAGSAGSSSATASPEHAHRPWGSWHVIDDGQGYKVKRIHVLPGQRLSYQTHQHRSEHWVVIFGVATCIVDGARIVAGPGESVDVPQGAPHRICNEHAEELIIIEVQHGAYTGEDDICRLEDDYGRGDDEDQPGSA